MALIGELAVGVVARVEKFVKGMGQARKEVKGFEASITKAQGAMRLFNTAAAAVATTGVAVMIKQQFAAVDALAKTSDKLGIATEALAGLQISAELSGVSLRALEMGLQRMGRRVSQAAIGTGEAQKALIELGLNAQRLNAMAIDQQFLEIADAMREVTSANDKLRLAQKLFDSEGVALVNTLNLGRDALVDITREAKEYGLAISRFDASKIEAANDAMTRMNAQLRGLAREGAITAAPGVSTGADLLSGFFGANRRLRDRLGLGFEFLATGFESTLNNRRTPEAARQRRQSAQTAKLVESNNIVAKKINQAISATVGFIRGGFAAESDLRRFLSSNEFGAQLRQMERNRNQFRANFREQAAGAITRRSLTLSALERGTAEAFRATRTRMETEGTQKIVRNTSRTVDELVRLNNTFSNQQPANVSP